MVILGSEALVLVISACRAVPSAVKMRHESRHCTSHCPLGFFEMNVTQTLTKERRRYKLGNAKELPGPSSPTHGSDVVLMFGLDE